MKIISHFKSKLTFIFLFSVVLFYIINNYIWLKLSSPFPTFFYYAFDFKRVIEFYESIKNFRLDLVVKQLINVHDAYVHSLTAALIALISGKSNIAINLFNNIPYFAIAVFSIYKIGEKISDRFTALLAVLIFSLYPAVYGTSRLYILEFAVMGMAPLCILCLLHTEDFLNRKYSLLFGVALGWGMLIKYSLLVFVVGPSIYILWESLVFACKKGSNNAVRFSYRIINIGFSALAALAIMGIKYFNPNNVKSYLLRPLYQTNVLKPWYSFDSLRIYTLGLFERQLSLPFFLILLFGLYGFFTKSGKKIIIIFFSWTIVPWLILLTMPHTKFTHYIIPYLPALALISATGIMNILKRNRKLKLLLIGSILAIGIIQYYDFSFEFGPNLSKYKIIIKDKDIHYYFQSEDICYPPKKDEAYDKIINSIAGKWAKYGSKVIRLPPNVYSYDNPHVWSCIRWFKTLPFEMAIFEENVSFITDVLDDLKKADFILYSDLKNKDIREPSYLDNVLKRARKVHEVHFDSENLAKIDQFLGRDLKKFKEGFYERINKFELVEKIYCGKEIYFYLYKKL